MLTLLESSRSHGYGLERIDSKSIAVVPIHDWDGSGDTLVCSESTAYGLFQLHPHMYRQALLTHSKARI